MTDKRIAELEAENTRLREVAERNFRWSYMLLTAFAKRLLAKANAERGYHEWPGGQNWDELVESSQSIFLHQVRDSAGIDHDDYLAGIRDGTYKIDDIYYEDAESDD